MKRAEITGQAAKLTRVTEWPYSCAKSATRLDWINHQILHFDFCIQLQSILLIIVDNIILRLLHYQLCTSCKAQCISIKDKEKKRILERVLSGTQLLFPTICSSGNGNLCIHNNLESFLNHYKPTKIVNA
jgi:hypothetical protein